MSRAPFPAYEFFAGGGMASLGLGDGWRTLFANDFDPAKAAAYRDNLGGDDLVCGDVWDIDPARLPGRADLAWASSPCQDLSLAGRREGLSGARSSAFWGFWRLIEALNREGRAPRTLVIENVTGLANSHGGQDFAALCEALVREGYAVGALEVDAALFLPQSRPRLFVIATRQAPPAGLTRSGPTPPFHGRRVVEAHARLPQALKAQWLWWSLPAPPLRNQNLAGALEPDGAVRWHSPAETQRLFSHLGPIHRARLDEALAGGERKVGALFRRTRIEEGRRVQRSELRFDGVAGCLRTPGGGSSRQFIVLAEGGEARSRPITPREAARLMGLPDDYRLPGSTTAALHLAGDGVAAPVVRHLARHIIEPLLSAPAAIAAE